MANYRRLLQQKLLEEHLDQLNSFAPSNVHYRLFLMDKGTYSLHKVHPTYNRVVFDATDIEEMMVFIEGMLEGISTERYH